MNEKRVEIVVYVSALVVSVAFFIEVIFIA